MVFVWLTATIGRNTCLMVAFSGFYHSPGLSPLSDLHGIVPVHRRNHQNGQQSWSIFCHHFVCCCPGGWWGNTEQVVAQWRHLVASSVALDMPHRAMLSALLQRTVVAIKMARDGGAFIWHIRLFCMIIRSYKTMLWSIKTNAELQ